MKKPKANQIKEEVLTRFLATDSGAPGGRGGLSKRESILIGIAADMVIGYADGLSRPADNAESEFNQDAKYILLRFSQRHHLNVSEPGPDIGHCGEIVMQGSTPDGFLERIIEQGLKDYVWQVQYLKEGGMRIAFNIGEFDYEQRNRMYDHLMAEHAIRLRDTIQAITQLEGQKADEENKAYMLAHAPDQDEDIGGIEGETKFVTMPSSMNQL